LANSSGARPLEAAPNLATRLVSAMAQPFLLARQVLHIGASIGIAVAPFDGGGATTLHKNADLALYCAKDDGRGRFHQHEQGVRNAMHDFGPGYSSLSLLRRVPFDHIKIKRCFVRDLGVHIDALPIIRALVGLGNSLGMQTALEGV
jgi:predicted signal transduction protein with EAL and GGDEF domain